MMSITRWVVTLFGISSSYLIITPTSKKPFSNRDNSDLLQLKETQENALTDEYNNGEHFADARSRTSRSPPSLAWRHWLQRVDGRRRTAEHHAALPVWITAKERPDEMIAWNTQYLPQDAEIHFLDDKSLNNTMSEMAAELDAEGITGVYDAFNCLVPPAFKADLFRAVVMYIHGGLYLDHKIKLVMNIDKWVNLSTDRVVVPKGKIPVQSSLLYSVPRHPLWPVVIRRIVSNVENQYYGDQATDPTGPGAVYFGLQEFGKSEDIRRDLVFHRPNGGLDLDSNSDAVQEYLKLGMSACFRLGDQMVAGDDDDLHKQHKGSSSLDYVLLWKQHGVYACSGSKKL